MENKSYNSAIIKVEDLIYLFTNLEKPKQFIPPKNTILRIIKFEKLKETYKIQENIILGVDIIKYDKIVQTKTKNKLIKTKQEQAVLLTTSKIKNISKLIDILNDDYVGINIFAKNE